MLVFYINGVFVEECRVVWHSRSRFGAIFLDLYFVPLALLLSAILVLVCNIG